MRSEPSVLNKLATTFADQGAVSAAGFATLVVGARSLPVHGQASLGFFFAAYVLQGVAALAVVYMPLVAGFYKRRRVWPAVVFQFGLVYFALWGALSVATIGGLLLLEPSGMEQVGWSGWVGASIFFAFQGTFDFRRRVLLLRGLHGCSSRSSVVCYGLRIVLLVWSAPSSVGHLFLVCAATAAAGLVVGWRHGTAGGRSAWAFRFAAGGGGQPGRGGV